jgi:hypothetical protein
MVQGPPSSGLGCSRGSLLARREFGTGVASHPESEQEAEQQAKRHDESERDAKYLLFPLAELSNHQPVRSQNFSNNQS